MPRRGKQKPPTTQRAFLSAGLNDDNTLHLESTYRDKPEEALLSLLKFAERWASHGSDEGEEHPPASRRAQKRPALVPPPSVPKVFSFLENLADELPDDDVLRTMNKEEKDWFLSQSSETRHSVGEELRRQKEHAAPVPLRFRVVRSDLPPDVKKRVLAKLERQNESLNPGDSMKYNTWVEYLLSVPLGQLLIPQPQVSLHATMLKAREHLNQCVYGHSEAKAAILERFYMWLAAPLAFQPPLALCGVPGNGKTSLIREGLAKVMLRPFGFVSLGGSTDSSFLLGHGYTYEGSLPGRLAEHLITSGCMNPILYFDELDKCSTTPKGEEVVNVLIHLTDPVQADKFRDRYLGNMDIDMSHALCVFSFNDPALVHPVLLDRLQVVKTDVFDASAQIRIAQTHVLPQILKERNLAPDAILVKEAAFLAVQTHLRHGGVRTLKSVLEQLVTKCTLWKETDDADFLLPLTEADVRRLPEDGGVEVIGGIQALFKERQSPELTEQVRSMYA